MNIHEAKEWLLGNRSSVNTLTQDPMETWETRIAATDAAMVQQAYWIVKAHREFLAADKDAEYRRKRMEIATAIMAAEVSHHLSGDGDWAIAMADELMAVNANRPIPGGAIL